jgi:UDP-N-acetyl-D-mannosaminuronic acid dehydrogenase
LLVSLDRDDVGVLELPASGLQLEQERTAVDEGIEPAMPKKIGVVGMGYVGLTLTAALARAGNEVHGVDAKRVVRESLSRGQPHIFEPGVAGVFAESVGSSIFINSELPHDLDAVMICVSTPVDEVSHRPDLSYLEAAARDIARWCAPGTLVVVRSTVPIGTSRRVVLPILQRAWGSVRLAMAPERTIQGQALRELVELPQVVGALDEASLAAAVDVFRAFATQVVPVSQLETAEMVKLSNNCHTDLIYSFGNELALIAESHGLDPLEVIRAANLDYPRPNLAKPGYVGGGCLSKDPYIMIDSAGDRTPFLIGQARKLNEYLPEHVGRKVVDMVREYRGSTKGARVSMLGWAYKGWPATDDMRGTPVAAIVPILADAGITVLGHDPMVSNDVIREYGGEPVSLDKALSEPVGILITNDHPDYRALQLDTALNESNAKFIYDSWRILNEEAVRAAGLGYAGIGYRTAAEASA